MSSFANAQFIGWDGEGYNNGKIDEWTERQDYVLLTTSTGESIYNPDGLTFAERMRFIYEMGIRYPKAIHVFFGGSYDHNKLLEGLPLKKVNSLHESSQRWTYYANRLALRYRPRKELTLAFAPPAALFRRGVSVRSTCVSYVRLWDVIGFFQTSFIQAVKQWLGADYVDYDLIASGKVKRLSFNESDKEMMIRYNAAEVRALVLILQKMWSHLDRLGLRIVRWDGAGAIAGEVFKHYRLTEAFYDPETKEKIELPSPIAEAVRYIYFGGRIECGFVGRHIGKVYLYDINSAYPHGASLIPNLNFGKWVHHRRPKTEDVYWRMNPLTLCRVQYYFHDDRLYYPFPHRTLNGSVIFPKRGERWLMLSEVKAAIKAARPHDQIHIYESYEWQSEYQRSVSIHATDNDRLVKELLSSNFGNAFNSPFSVLESIYHERQTMVANGDAAEKILKLGLNSIYGKLCQKLGWDQQTGKSPRYHFLLFAAFITAACRSRIYEAIADSMDDVIAINTDGIVSRAELPLEIGADKPFGGWSLEMADEIVQIQSGVYWLRKGERWSEKARGLGRVVGHGDTETEREENRNDKIIERLNRIEAALKNGDDATHFEVKQFVTSSKARISEKWFPRWGGWYIMHDEKRGTPGRSLDLQLKGFGKRRIYKSIDPSLLNRTTAAENIAWNGVIGKDDPKRRDLGEPYDLPWLSMTSADENEFVHDDDLSEI